MADLYRFDYRVVDRDRDSYYITPWDRAKPVAVVAATKAEAVKKIWAVMGEAPRGRYWTADLKSVTDARLTDALTTEETKP